MGDGRPQRCAVAHELYCANIRVRNRLKASTNPRGGPVVAHSGGCQIGRCDSSAKAIPAIESARPMCLMGLSVLHKTIGVGEPCAYTPLKSWVGHVLDIFCSQFCSIQHPISAISISHRYLRAALRLAPHCLGYCWRPGSAFAAENIILSGGPHGAATRVAEVSEAETCCK